MVDIERSQTDILILGSGGAGLFAALHAHKAAPEQDITVAVKGLLGKCGCTRMVQGGYNVVFVPRRNSPAEGEWEVFADGFSGTDPVMSPSDAQHRPTGLALGPDGSLYVTDDVGGRIWKISYTGN
mgnify:CR=1 FL=1